MKYAVALKVALLSIAVHTTATPAGAATLRTIQTAQYGSRLCWVGNNAGERIVDDRNVNCLQGRGGRDLLHGLGGPDLIDGEESTRARDDMWGGSGSDTFYVGWGLAPGHPEVDRIWDMAANERICTSMPFTAVRRIASGTSGNHRYIQAQVFSGSGQVWLTIAWVANLGTKPIRVHICWLTD